MKKYPEYKQLDLVQIAEEINHFWKTHDTFTRSIENRAGKASFTFYEGPPSANGEPGIHHVLSRALKDLFCRYKTLRGYQVKRKSGWDWREKKEIWRISLGKGNGKKRVLGKEKN